MKGSTKKLLEESLLPEEKAHWVEGPQPFALLAKPFTLRVALSWIIGIPLCIAIIIITINDLDGTMGPVLFGMFLILMPAMIAVNPLTQRRELIHATAYAVTDQRLLTVINCSRENNSFSIPLKKIEQVEVELTGQDCATVYINRACKVRTASSRVKASFGFMDDDHVCLGMVLYNIKRWRTLCALLPVDYTMRAASADAVGQEKAAA